MKSDRTVNRELRRLRAFIEAHPDDATVESRIAQAVEYGIRWAREDVRDWPKPLEDAHAMAGLIRDENGLPRRK